MVILVVMTVQLSRKHKTIFLVKISFLGPLPPTRIHHTPEEHVHVVILIVKDQSVLGNMQPTYIAISFSLKTLGLLV